jgi:hypothetical protein
MTPGGWWKCTDWGHSLSWELTNSEVLENVAPAMPWLGPKHQEGLWWEACASPRAGEAEWRLATHSGALSCLRLSGQHADLKHLT